MSKEKQIEEMALIIEEAYDNAEMTGSELNCYEVATHVYNAGYRKQSEGEWVEKSRKRTFWRSDMADIQVVCQTVGYTCSVCGKGSRHTRYTNYCPNCGAKMKGGAE